MLDSPRFSEPVGLLTQAMPGETVRFIDVGANIGDTVALVELYAPGRCVFLCIEPDSEFVELCKLNTASLRTTTVVQAVIDDGPQRRLSLSHHTPGTALTECRDAENGLVSTPLDALALDFLSTHGGIDVIKIDTDGFDAKVLRSSKTLLQTQFPMLFFELHPYFWKLAGENPLETFKFLKEHGYHDYVFFTNRGSLYSHVIDPTEPFLQTLTDISLSRRAIDDFHYDVLTGRSEICAAVAEMSLRKTATLGLL
jgi:FkbM family methyltransferase